MNNSVRETAYRKLDAYIEESNRRKTPERYAILDAIYDIKGHFSVEQLKEKLNNAHFPVSRATLFNSLKLFQELSIIVRHNFRDGTRYEACMTDEPKCHQICNVCNKVTEISIPMVVSAIDNHRYKRFRKEGFSLYVYGICSSCQARLTRERKKENSKKKNRK